MADLTTGVPRRVDLAVQGMSCASCAARVERTLNGLEGVRATVNFATGTARVLAPEDLEVAELIAAVEQLGYSAEPGKDPWADHGRPEHDRPEQGTSEQASQSGSDREQSGRDQSDGGLRRRLVVTAPAAIVVLALSMVPALQFDSWQWVALALATPVALWGAWPFHRAGWRALRHRSATMDTLVSLGVLAAWTWSLRALLFTSAGDPQARMSLRPVLGHAQAAGQAHLYLEVAAGITVFMLAGRLAESRARRRAGAALRALLDLGAREVTVLEDTGGDRPVPRRVPVGRLVPGDLFAAVPGETIATDAVVVEGMSAVDESLLTGEAVPVDVGPGDTVTGGTLNTSGHLVLRAVRVGRDTALARITRLVVEAQSGKAPVQRLADRVSAVFVPVVVALSALTLGAWLWLDGDVETAFTAAVAVLIVACPCALGLATPTALLVGTGRGAQLGILVRGPEVLERTHRLDVILLDKTGTLTEGAMSLVEAVPTAGTDVGDLLRYAGAIEQGSEHPLGRAVVAGALERVGALPGFDRFESAGGRGVRGLVTSGSVTHEVVVGRPAWVAARLSAPDLPRTAPDLPRTAPDLPRTDEDLPPENLLPGDLLRTAEGLGADGRTTVLVAWDGVPRGVLALADTAREGSREAVSAFRALGLRPILLTGDAPAAARAVARDVGIDPDDVYAAVLPEEKADKVHELQAAGHRVAMLGDGVNDAAALARADLGIAMGSGTDVAIEASDLTLVRPDPRAAADAVLLARRILRTVRQNLFWAFFYNVAMLPIAALGLLDPLLAGAAMAFSSVLVLGNSLRLRGFTPAGR
ncbi:MAG: P-type Cu+ transporter [Actinomycetota bacterium]|nr:P-type Cu+ transporter [Actinomycetota bacterium]